GKWMTAKSEHLTADFSASWDLANVTTGFPMVSCVVFGKRSASATCLPSATIAWNGRLARADIPWAEAKAKITTSPGEIVAHVAGQEVPTSPYKDEFRQGAVLAPRVTLFVTETSAGPLGPGAGRVAVTSHRSTLEKEPWKSIPSLTARVESKYVRPVYLGETVLPFRSVDPRKAVLPISGTEVLSESEIARDPGLASWWETAESVWAKNKSPQDTSRLLDRIDYHGQLTAQLPLARQRVVYTKAGNSLCATIIRDPTAIVDTSLYWSAVPSVDEAAYLCAVLNSEALLERVKPLQTLGLFGARHFDKYVFLVPFPKFDPTDRTHTLLASLASDAEQKAQAADVSGARTFQAARKIVRAVLKADGVGDAIEAAVAELIPPVL
ncbi:SAM-dependent DNA methyltransferase, partial [Gordonia sp. ABSL1-1]|nr:SAM-dependent DNA methyltransferase [Gordonia sp. ABSL1-1]